jgi:hypothetical protein
MTQIQLDPNVTSVPSDAYPEAITYIQNDAPGYQIDFYPIDMQKESIALSDCRVYGLNSLAIQVCLKQTNNSFLAGTSHSNETNGRMECVSR